MSNMIGRQEHVATATSTNNSERKYNKARVYPTPTSCAMTDQFASAKLDELQAMLEQNLYSHPANKTTTDLSDDVLQQLKQSLASFNKDCTPLQVFGCEHEGVLPVTSYDNQYGRQVDQAGTMALRKDIRRTWEARYVRGDGNCLWRAASESFFGSERWWVPLKLVTLSHAAAHFDEIRHHVLVNHYDFDISEKYGKAAFVQLDDGTSVHIPDLARTDLMLLASIFRLCRFGQYAGSIACRLIVEALGIKVKILHQIDTKSRKQKDFHSQKHGSGRNGTTFDDARWSHTFAPQGTPSKAWRVQGTADQSFKFREEVAVALVISSTPLDNPTPATHQTLPEVERDSERVDESCNHFAAIVNIAGSTAPFPMYTCAPALYAEQDARDKQLCDEEFRHWKQRNEDRAKACATSTAPPQPEAELAGFRGRRHSARVAASTGKRRDRQERKRQRRCRARYAPKAATGIHQRRRTYIAQRRQSALDSARRAEGPSLDVGAPCSTPV